MLTNFDKSLIEDVNARYYGVKVDKLMESAGKGIAEILIKKYGKNKSYNIVCGVGSNGGDGLVAARYLIDAGVKDICVYLIGRINNIRSEASLSNLEKLKSEKYKICRIVTDAFAKEINQADITLECLIGTGIKGKLNKRFKDVIVKITKQRSQMVAVDVPVPGYKPHLAISIGYPKVSNAVTIDLDLPLDVKNLTGPGEVKLLKTPDLDSYKSQNGELLVYAGSEQFHGAPVMALRAASKLVGSVFFYTNPENREIVKNSKLELQEFIVADDNSLEKYANYATAFLFGPGLEANLPTKGIISALLREFPDKPAILDAYAIAVASEKGLLENKVLTPHRGELRHIFGEDFRSNKQPLEGLLKRFAVQNKCYILLKGHTDILFSRDGAIVFNKTGNAGMAKGGTGDILAGILGAFMTQNDIWLSMRAAAFINGLAGDKCYAKYGYNYSATDLIQEIQISIKECLEF